MTDPRIFPIENGLNRQKRFHDYFFYFALECHVREVQETDFGLDIHSSNQILPYMDDFFNWR